MALSNRRAIEANVLVPCRGSLRIATHGSRGSLLFLHVFISVQIFGRELYLCSGSP